MSDLRTICERQTLTYSRVCAVDTFSAVTYSRVCVASAWSAVTSLYRRHRWCRAAASGHRPPSLPWSYSGGSSPAGRRRHTAGPTAGTRTGETGEVSRSDTADRRASEGGEDGHQTGNCEESTEKPSSLSAPWEDIPGIKSHLHQRLFLVSFFTTLQSLCRVRLSAFGGQISSVRGVKGR